MKQKNALTRVESVFLHIKRGFSEAGMSGARSGKGYQNPEKGLQKFRISLFS